jgi:hypothetical protein
VPVESAICYPNRVRFGQQTWRQVVAAAMFAGLAVSSYTPAARSRGRRRIAVSQGMRAGMYRLQVAEHTTESKCMIGAGESEHGQDSRGE